MLDAAGVTGMLQWVQAVVLRSYVITCHLELKERSGEKTIAKPREELISL